MSLATRVIEREINDLKDRIKFEAEVMESCRIAFENHRDQHQILVAQVKQLQEAINALPR